VTNKNEGDRQRANMADSCARWGRGVGVVAAVKGGHIHRTGQFDLTD
jgi:hypothetical protein